MPTQGAQHEDENRGHAGETRAAEPPGLDGVGADSEDPRVVTTGGKTETDGCDSWQPVECLDDDALLARSGTGRRTRARGRRGAKRIQAECSGRSFSYVLATLQANARTAFDRDGVRTLIAGTPSARKSEGSRTLEAEDTDETEPAVLYPKSRSDAEPS